MLRTRRMLAGGWQSTATSNFTRGWFALGIGIIGVVQLTLRARDFSLTLASRTFQLTVRDR